MKQLARYRQGDAVVYRMQKHSVKPGPRALNVYATPQGETYIYEVEKYWTVQETRDDGSLVVVTRQGKNRLVRCDDPNLRRATWWERTWHQRRFPSKVTHRSDTATSPASY